MSNAKLYLFVFCVITISTISVLAQKNSTKRSYCFNFSWIGPKYSNESEINNATCEDFTNLAQNVPCRLPLVVTNDASYPDIDYIWENHFDDTTCLLAEGEVCVSYTYMFDSKIQNVTYMCTKVTDQKDNSISSGCHQMKSGSRQVDLCVCRSTPGMRPCNAAVSVNFVPALLLLALSALLIVYRDGLLNS